MQVREAKEAAYRWVAEEGVRTPGFCGALFHGSTNWLPEDAVLPSSSDVDVLVVLDDPGPPAGPGKFLYRGALLEVSSLSRERLRSAEQVLGEYQIVGSFRTPGIIADPTGWLTELQAAVARDYARRRWVRLRCERALENVRNALRARNESAPFHEQVTSWLFANGITTHVLLVAGLKNPTVRSRYGAVRGLLAEYGLSEFYETLLEMLGCARLSPERAARHLAALSEAFDAAGAMLKTPYRFAADLRPAARPVAIDGSRELIERGSQREAVFWMAAVYSRCLWVLARDAPPETQARFETGYRDLINDLSITSLADLRRRVQELEAFLPRVWETAETILAANPEVEDDTPPPPPPALPPTA